MSGSELKISDSNSEESDDSINTMSGMASLKWVEGSNGSIPQYAVAGREEKNAPGTFVCRTFFNQHLIPGAVIPSQHCAFVALQGSKITHANYEVLTNPKHCKLTWEHTDKGKINSKAVAGGYDKIDGTTYYIGRHMHEGHLVVGKVLPQKHECWIPYGGYDHVYKEYEVLVCESE